MTPRLLMLAAAVVAITSAAPAQAGRDRVSGTWEPVGGTCGGDDHVTFARDGTYSAYAESGTWRLRGSRLETVILRRGEPGDAMREAKPPEREEAVVLSLSAGTMAVRATGGSVRRLHRCR
jgi:hypothetical protein